MLILPIDDAKSGMTLAAPVANPERPDQDLLRGGYVLEDEVIARLRSMSISCIYVDYPGLDELDRHLATNLSPARQNIFKQIKQSISTSQKNSRAAVSYDSYYACTRDLITTLLSQGQHPIYMEHLSGMGGDIVAHSTAVAHLGLLLGMKLENYIISQRKRLPPHHAKEVVNLGVAGMLHDMGKVKLPPDIQKFTGINPPTDPAQLKEWENHSSLSYDAIRGGVEPSAAAAVMHHHQHWDGSGFPITVYRDGSTKHPKEEQIHVFSRIIGVANLYDRLATSGENNSRRLNLEILHLMRTHYAGWCDPTVMKMLEVVTPPFPPGSIVRLSDNTQAIVVDVDPATPYEPIIKRVIGDDLKLDETRLKLADPGAPSITHIGKLAVEPLMPGVAAQTA